MLKSTADSDIFLQGLVTVVKVDIKIRGADRTVGDMVGRLNFLRKENGYPEVTMEELLPLLPPEDGERNQPSSPAVDKGEFLLRHPPDEYNKVDKVRT